MKLILIMIIISLIGVGVRGAETWTSESWGGSVEISGVETWYSESFGGEVTVEYFKYDVDHDNDVDTDDINITVGNLTLTGTPGWIYADVNSDGVIDYLDIGGVCFWYPWSSV